MKKLYTILSLTGSVLFCSLQAQVNVSSSQLVPTPVQNIVHKGGNMTFGIDTFAPPAYGMPCFTGDATPFVYYNIGAAGYLTGTNSIGVTECAQRYTFTGTGTISEVLVWYGKKTGTTGTTYAHIYSIDPTTKKPVSILGSSAAVTTATIVTNNYTSYLFSTAVPVTTDFAAACALPIGSTIIPDTVVVVSTKLKCSSDSMSYVNISGWRPIAQLLNKTGTPRDTSIDLVILPVVNTASGINEYPSHNGLSLLGVSPNPAKDIANIQYKIDATATVAIEIFDLTGRTIHQSSEKMPAGNHVFNFQLKGIAPGNYYYTINTGSARLTSKFVVTQ